MCFFFSSSSPCQLLLLALLLLLGTSGPADGAKILFTFYHDRGSHFGSMLPMMEKLAKRGHHVSVLDTIFPEDKSPLIRHIRTMLPQDDEEEAARAEFAQFFWEMTDTLAQQHRHNVSVLFTFSPDPPASLRSANIRPLTAPLPHQSDNPEQTAALNAFIWNQTVSSVTVSLMVFAEGDDQLGELMDLWPAKVAEVVDEQWDLIVTDDLFWCFGFALVTLKQRLWEGGARKGPEPRSIVYATAGQTLLSAESVKATSRNWVSKSPLFPYMPTNSSDVYSPSRFVHRVFAFYENFAEHLLMNVFVEALMLPNIARFGVPKFSWYEMYRRSSLQYSDSIDRLGWPLAQGPEMINVGAHCKETKKLPEEFRAFVEDPKSEGTIYVAFGTYPEWNLAPARILTALIGAFQRLSSYRIIFAYNGPPIPGLGRHIKLAKWAPQLDILAHPKTRAYITHGGLKSVREGLCAGVPLIVMPLFAEQSHNAHLVLAMGIGPVINKYTLTPDSVHASISKVVSDPESGPRARRFRALFLDRPMDALEEGAFWVDRLTRLQPGRRATFVRQGIHLDWARFVYADWAALVLVLVLLVAKR